jgi:hypothetical protein
MGNITSTDLRCGFFKYCIIWCIHQHYIVSILKVSLNNTTQNITTHKESNSPCKQCIRAINKWTPTTKMLTNPKRTYPETMCVLLISAPVFCRGEGKSQIKFFDLSQSMVQNLPWKVIRNPSVHNCIRKNPALHPIPGLAQCTVRFQNR